MYRFCLQQNVFHAPRRVHNWLVTSQINFSNNENFKDTHTHIFLYICLYIHIYVYVYISTHRWQIDRENNS